MQDLRYLAPIIIGFEGFYDLYKLTVDPGFYSQSPLSLSLEKQIEIEIGKYTLLVGSLCGLRVTAGALALAFRGASKVSDLVGNDNLSQILKQTSGKIFSFAIKNFKRDLAIVSFVCLGSFTNQLIQNEQIVASRSEIYNQILAKQIETVLKAIVKIATLIFMEQAQRYCINNNIAPLVLNFT